MGKRITAEEAKPAVERGEPIHIKYRPRDLKDVLGQGATAKSLAAILKGKSPPHCYLFTGPAGTGKTTLARIMAAELGVDERGIIEVDAALKTGVDDMRELTSGLRYNGFGDSPNKAIILNECHRLSAQAWDSLLMTTEEPPAHAFFFFTSTDPAKIPKAMATRCTTYALGPLRNDDLMDLLEEVCDREDYPTTKKCLQLVATASQGSARLALTMLAKVHACETEDEARDLLQAAEDRAEVIELCRDLVAGRLEWKPAMKTLKALDAQGINPEGIRLTVVNYLNACLMGENARNIPKLLDMLECFMKPATGSEKMAPLLLAFGRFIYP